MSSRFTQALRISAIAVVLLSGLIAADQSRVTTSTGPTSTTNPASFDAPPLFVTAGPPGHVPASFNAVASGDFNGDGIPDFAAVGLACAAGLGDWIAVFLGNGNGTFQPATLFPAGHCTSDVTAA